MYSIILDAPDVLICCSIIDAIVDVVTNIFWWEVMVEIIVCSFVNLLVVTMVWLMGSMMLIGVPIMAIVMRLLIAVIIVVPFGGHRLAVNVHDKFCQAAVRHDSGGFDQRWRACRS